MLAETLLKQGYPDLATDTMAQLVEAAPDNLEAQVRLAQLYDYQKNDARALDILQAVTRTDPNYAVAWESTARVAIDANDIPLAESAIHTLAKLPGQQMTADFLAGQIETKAGNNQAAAGTYTRIIDNDSASPLAEHALAALADTNASAGRLADTIGYLEALKSKTAYTDTLLGESYIRQGKPDQAKAALDRALAHSPTDQKPFLDEAALYVKAHQPDQALEVLKKGAEAIPGDIRAPMMQADILNQLGRYAEAIAVYQAVLKRSPGLAVAANNLGALIADYQYTDKTSLQGAIDLMQKFSQADRPELLDTLAWLYYRQGNSEAALATIEREATFVKDTSPEMHYHNGAIYLKNGKPADAKRELQLATATDAKYPGLDNAKSMLAGL
jgi:tetratricopeptide (TPR) repeat protein